VIVLVARKRYFVSGIPLCCYDQNVMEREPYSKQSFKKSVANLAQI
jgi:hypothetical protein